jgi:hypothetical protein
VTRDDAEGLAHSALSLTCDSGLRQKVIAEQKTAIEQRHRASVVARAYERLYLELIG